jgi:hypothetical protein
MSEDNGVVLTKNGYMSQEIEIKHLEVLESPQEWMYIECLQFLWN